MNPDGVLEKAQQETLREELLLARRFDALSPPVPVPELTAAPSVDADLEAAVAEVNPSSLLPGTRAASLKRGVLRVLRLYTAGQINFNTHLTRVVAGWHYRIKTLLKEIPVAFSSLEARFSGELRLHEQRRELWESRLSGELDRLEARMAALEADHAAIEDRFVEVSETARSIGPLGDAIARQDARLDDLTSRVAFLRHLEERLGDLDLPTGFYFEFEKRCRGTREDILERQKVYIPILSRAAESLGSDAEFVDLGCGRGELLELAAQSGLRMTGFDRDPTMVTHCRSLGLHANQGDLFEALETFADGSLAGICALQVIEHLPYRSIVKLLDMARAKLHAGGRLILETIDPDSWTAMRNFYLDPTHRQPVPAATCEFLMKSQGFVDVETLHLNRLRPEAGPNEEPRDETLRVLREILWGPQDYAATGVRP